MTDKKLTLFILKIKDFPVQWRVENTDWEDDLFESKHGIKILIDKNTELSYRYKDILLIGQKPPDIVGSYALEHLEDIRLAVHEDNVAHGHDEKGSVQDIYTCSWLNLKEYGLSEPIPEKIGTLEIIQ